MSFKVNAADIKAYGEMIGRAKDDMSAGSSHLKESVARISDNPPSGGSLLWKGVLGQHRNLVSKVDATLKQYERVLGSSERELEKSARYYRTTDEDEARRVDATYPNAPSGAPKSLPDTGSGGFTDREDARGSLESEHRDPIEQRYDKVFGGRHDSFAESFSSGKELALLGNGVGLVLDITSPSTLINEGLKLAFNFDVLDEFAQMIAGDWGTFGKMEAVWAQLQGLCDAVSTNVAGGNDTLSATWQGQAAAAGWNYFDGLVTSLAELADSFDRLIRNYEELATDINAFVSTLKAAITMILDKAVEVGLKAAAGGTAAATGIGLVLTAAAAAAIAYDIIQMVNMYSKVLQALTILFGVLNTIEGSSTSDLEKELSKITNFPTPGNSYDHRAV